MLYLGIFLLAGLGALLRFGLTEYWGSAVGVLVANVLGSAAIGYILSLPQSLTTKIVTIGLLGALTTFSSYSVEVVNAMGSGQLMRAGGIMLGHNVLAIGACIVAYKLSS